jgi:hypothetical protein
MPWLATYGLLQSAVTNVMSKMNSAELQILNVALQAISMNEFCILD